MAVSSSGITGLLRAWSEGDDRALDKLTSIVYEELYRLARFYMAGERPDHILQTTALISEIYVKINRLQRTDWQNRSHFFGVCSHLMQHILTDYARSQLYLKRGGDAEEVPLQNENTELPDSHTSTKLIALTDALRDLAALDERVSRVVQLHFFGGFSLKEIAEVLNLSERTVKRDWKFGKLWLAHELKSGNEQWKQR